MKAKLFLESIIEASSKQEAKEILKAVYKALHLDNGYNEMMTLLDRAKEFSEELDALETAYRDLDLPRSYHDVHELRMELTFLYRRISDELSFDINKNKMFWEESKSIKKAEAMLELARDEKFQSTIKAPSTNALANVYGASDIMTHYANMYSISYGAFKKLDTLLISAKSFMDALSSEERSLINIESNKTT